MLVSRGLIAAALVWATACFGQPAESRIGRTFWAQPSLVERSVDFFEEPALRKRIPVREKTDFVILGIVMAGPWPHEDPVYRVALPGDREAFLDVGDFERRLYQELRPNQVAVSPGFEPPLGRGVQVHTFERSSFFESDPGVIWSRVKNQGPRTLTVIPRIGAPLPQVPPVVTRRKLDPAEPVIRPR